MRVKFRPAPVHIVAGVCGISPGNRDWTAPWNPPGGSDALGAMRPATFYAPARDPLAEKKG